MGYGVRRRRDGVEGVQDGENGGYRRLQGARNGCSKRSYSATSSLPASPRVCRIFAVGVSGRIEGLRIVSRGLGVRWSCWGIGVLGIEWRGVG